MTDKKVYLQGLPGPIPIKAIDNGDGTYSLAVDIQDAELTVEDMTFDRVFVKTNATGSGAIAASAAAAGDRRLVSVTVHLSAAPASAGSLTITLNAAAGAAYDTVLSNQSMVGATDLVYLPDEDLFLVTGDAIDVAYANPDSRTYGVQITLETI